MKTGIVVAALALTCLSAVGCAGATAHATPPAAPLDVVAAQDAVARELDDLHAAAGSADEARYFGHFAPDGVFLGTDATERWDLAAFHAYAHPRFAKGHGWVFHPERRAIVISPDGATAWFDEDLLGDKLGPARGSGVLVRSRRGRYLVKQYNLTLTIPNERFAEVHALLESPAHEDLGARYKRVYAEATRDAAGGDLTAARQKLGALVPEAKTRPTDDLEFWLHNELTWLAWAEGDAAGAMAEVDRAKATLDHAELGADKDRSLRLHERWDRAYLLLEAALAAPAKDRTRQLAAATAAHESYVALATPAGDHDGAAVLDAFFAARRGDAKGARAAATQVDVDHDDDLQDLYVLALAFDVAHDAARAEALRARICGGHDYLMKPLIVRTMAREGHPCR